MNEQYNSLFEKTIADYCKNLKTVKEKADVKYIFSYPNIGKSYDRGRVMVVGRPMDGWKFPFTINNNWEKSFKELVKATETNQKTMTLKIAFRDFIKRRTLEHKPVEKLYLRSRFWQVLQAITCSLDSTTVNDEWFYSIAWTNIFKINPYFRAFTANMPDEIEIKSQLLNNNVLELFKLEIETLKPKLILMFEDEIWTTPMLKYLGLKVENKDEIVKQAVKYKDSLILVCKRPDMMHKGLSNEMYIDAIVKAAKKK